MPIDNRDWYRNHHQQRLKAPRMRIPRERPGRSYHPDSDFARLLRGESVLIRTSQPIVRKSKKWWQFWK